MGSEMVLLVSSGFSCTLANELTPKINNIIRTVIGNNSIINFFISPPNENFIWFFEA